MFERFTAPARRVLFWARAEAAQLGSDWIEPEHLLLGVVAEDQRDWMRYTPALPDEMVAFARATASPAQFFSAETAAKLRQILTASAGTPKTGMIDMPLARHSQDVLAATAERTKRSQRSHITLLDILAGLMTDASISEVLRSVGITIVQIDDAIRQR